MYAAHALPVWRDLHCFCVTLLWLRGTLQQRSASNSIWMCCVCTFVCLCVCVFVCVCSCVCVFLCRPSLAARHPPTKVCCKIHLSALCVRVCVCVCVCVCHPSLAARHPPTKVCFETHMSVLCVCTCVCLCVCRPSLAARHPPTKVCLEIHMSALCVCVCTCVCLCLCVSPFFGCEAPSNKGLLRNPYECVVCVYVCVFVCVALLWLRGTLQQRFALKSIWVRCVCVCVYSSLCVRLRTLLKSPVGPQQLAIASSTLCRRSMQWVFVLLTISCPNHISKYLVLLLCWRSTQSVFALFTCNPAQIALTTNLCFCFAGDAHGEGLFYLPAILPKPH